MRLQLLSDLHLETEDFDPRPAPGAELLVLAGDIDSTWQALRRFAGWPVPVVMVAGNHEFDRRDLTGDLPALREAAAACGIRLLECEHMLFQARDGRRIRLLGATRWADFDLLGARERPRAERAAGYYLRVMRAQIDGAPFDVAAMRRVGLASRAWLAGALAAAPAPGEPMWDATVVITHFAPSLRSADPRYGATPGTASFCNADDDLLPGAELWLHGHLHCRHDYTVAHADGRRTRVVCHPRGLAAKGEPDGHEPVFTVVV